MFRVPVYNVVYNGYVCVKVVIEITTLVWWQRFDWTLYREQLQTTDTIGRYSETVCQTSIIGRFAVIY
jgi:hypothetical protein